MPKSTIPDDDFINDLAVKLSSDVSVHALGVCKGDPALTMLVLLHSGLFWSRANELPDAKLIEWVRKFTATNPPTGAEVKLLRAFLASPSA